MDLVDRYVAAVKPYLPAQERDDILHELEENLRSQIEDREGDNGRSLDEAEMAAILERFGNPADVADRYRQNQGVLAFGRTWIGPLLFPCYRRVLTINVSLAVAVCVVITVAMGKSLLDVVSPLAVTIAIQWAIVTAIFIAAERGLQRYRENWDASDPAKIPEPTGGGTSNSRVGSLGRAVLNALFLHWVVSAHQATTSILGDAAAEIAFGPVWGQIYWPIVLILVVNIVQATISFFRPQWFRFATAIQIASGVLFLGVASYMLVAGNWLVVLPKAVDHQGISEKVMFANRFIFLPTVLSIVVIAAVALVTMLYRVTRSVHRVVAAE